MNGPKVRVGDWYLDRDQHDFLYVIDVDEEEGVIDVRDEYGDIDEIDFAEWERKPRALQHSAGVERDRGRRAGRRLSRRRRLETEG